MSSLASSPPKASSSQPGNNWSRAQAYQESQMRGQPMDPGGEAFSMSEMTHMRQSEMGMGRPGMSRGRQFAGDGRGGGGGGQYGSAHMQHLSPGYHGPSQAYLRCLGGDAEYAGDMSEFGEYGEFGMGKKMHSVSSAVREVATRMNEVRLGHVHNAQMMSSHQHMGQHEHMAGDFAHRGGSADMMASMRERMAMGGGAHVMRGHAAHDGKMHQGYGGAMMMHLGHMGRHGGMPYMSGPSMPFAAMHAAGYSGAAVGVSAGMGGAGAGGFDVAHHRSGVGPQVAKHNKYCHFCQHVKVRASGMLACCNKDCTRRFCEHCLSKSIGDDVNPQTSTAWVNGQWHCPVCRKLCCCAIGDCDKNHRHCKAYRYRVRRAEQQAVKRAGTTQEDQEGAEVGDDGDDAVGDEARDRGEGKPKGGKAQAAVEISDEAVKGVTEVAEGAPGKMPEHKMLKQETPALPPHIDGGMALGTSSPPAATHMKAEDPADGEPLAPAPSPCSTGAPSVAASIPVPSPSSLVSSGARMRQVRRAEANGSGGGGASGQVDLNDVQTMADSWLRLLEEEENDMVGADFLNGLDSQASSYNEADGLMGGDGAHHQRIARHAAKSMGSNLGFMGSSDSLYRIMSGEEGGPLFGSASSQSLSELVQRDGTLSRNVSRDSFMVNDGLSRNVSNASLTEMVRNYSSASLEAVMEQSEAWPQDPSAYSDKQPTKGGGGGGGGEEYDCWHGSPSASSGGMPSMHIAYNYPQQPSISTGKRMQRTNSHNKLVHEAVSSHVGRGLPRPASYEKLSRQCGVQDSREGSYRGLPTSKEEE